MTVTEALQFRRAVPKYDPSVKIEREELFRLLNTANLAPSSMNLQPWQYLVCLSQADKDRLQATCFNQPKVTQASAGIVVLGNMRHFENAERVAENNIRIGYLTEDRKQGFIAGAHGGWKTEQAQRDEAFRAGNLWAMSFMLAAAEAGWDTSPLGGYDAEKVSAEFGLPDHIVPVLVVLIGKRDPELNMLPRSDRFSAEELAHEGNY